MAEPDDETAPIPFLVDVVLDAPAAEVDIDLELMEEDAAARRDVEQATANEAIELSDVLVAEGWIIDVAAQQTPLGVWLVHPASKRTKLAPWDEVKHPSCWGLL